MTPRYDAEVDRQIEEAKQKININRKTCIIFYRYGHWVVWRKGLGDIGYGYSRDEAIENAKAKL